MGHVGIWKKISQAQDAQRFNEQMECEKVKQKPANERSARWKKAKWP